MEKEDLSFLKQCQRERDQWQRECATWLAEIKRWRREEQKILGLLFNLEHAIPDYRKLLDVHFDTIRTHEKGLGDFEAHLLDCHLNGLERTQYQTLLTGYQLHARQHTRVKKAHMELQSKTKAAMAEQLQLTRALITALENAG